MGKTQSTTNLKSIKLKNDTSVAHATVSNVVNIAKLQVNQTELAYYIFKSLTDNTKGLVSIDVSNKVAYVF